VGWTVKWSIDADAKAQFASTCDEVVQKIRERLAFYESILRGGVGLFAGSQAVTRSEWRTYFEKLTANQPLAGMESFGVIKLIRQRELHSHIAAVRAEGYPDYMVRPEGSREDYAPIVLKEPFKGRNVRTLGMDVFAEPIRRAALEQSRDSGRSAITGKIVLYQEPVTDIQPPGFVMVAPIYQTGAPLATTEQRRSALIGWVDSAYRMQSFMAEILRHQQNRGSSGAAVFVYDRTEPIAAKLMYSSSREAPDRNSPFYVERKVDFNGHPWLVVFDRDPAAAMSYAAAWLSVGAGVVISVLLFVLALLLRSSRSDSPGTSKR